MADQPILVAVPADTFDHGNYRWHATPSTYLDALVEVAGATPVIVPALLPRMTIAPLLDRVDGVLLTGAASNVHPERYGAPASRAHEPFDPERDRLTEALIKGALERSLPLLCICRGHQELNVALGGTLATEIQEIDGRMDHRHLPSHDQRERFAIRHEVALEPGGTLGSIVGEAEIRVNSLHRQAIDRLADGLAVEARAPDGTVEAVRVKDAANFALGVQWHPEFWATTDEPSRKIFHAFAAACRTFAASRGRA